MAKGGAQWQDRLNALGTALSGYGSALSGNPMYLQNSLLLRQAQQQQAEREQQQRQDQTGNAAALSYLRSGMMEGTPATKQMTMQGPAGEFYPAFAGGNRTIGQNREATPVSTDPLRSLALFANGSTPLQSIAAKRAIDQLYPQGFTGTVGQDQIAYQNGKVVAEGPKSVRAPDKLPAEAELAKWLFGGNETAAREYLKNKDAPKQEGSWRTLTPAEAQQMNLNPSGSYQVNEKGQIQVITQPKQDAPTETQTKYATLATRMGDALSVADKVLKEDPSAISSVLLSATEDLPMGGAAIGRKWSNPNAQILRNSLTDAVDAAITMGTGAAYNQEQLVAKRNSLLPQIGEPAKVKQEKFRKLMVEYEAGKKAARAAGVDLPDAGVFAGLYGIEAGAPSPANNNSDPLGIRGR